MLRNLFTIGLILSATLSVGVVDARTSLNPDLYSVELVTDQGFEQFEFKAHKQIIIISEPVNIPIPFKPSDSFRVAVDVVNAHAPENAGEALPIGQPKVISTDISKIERGDFDGDGLTDLLIDSGVSSEQVFVVFGSDDLSIPERIAYLSQDQVAALSNGYTLKDLDGDGKLEIAVYLNNILISAYTFASDVSEGSNINVGFVDYEADTIRSENGIFYDENNEVYPANVVAPSGLNVGVNKLKGAIQVEYSLKLPPSDSFVPSLSINKFDDASMGLLGVGWTLSAYSKISDCTTMNENYKIEKIPCVDGSVLISNPNGEGYVTKVIPNGDSSVYIKDESGYSRIGGEGTVYKYDIDDYYNGDYYLTSVETNGGEVTVFEYSAGLLQGISYDDIKVQFYYVPDVGYKQYYSDGESASYIKKMIVSSVKVKKSESQIREYNFTYNLNNSPMLKTFQSCAYDVSGSRDCEAAYEIDYSGVTSDDKLYLENKAYVAGMTLDQFKMSSYYSKMDEWDSSSVNPHVVFGEILQLETDFNYTNRFNTIDIELTNSGPSTISTLVDYSQGTKGVALFPDSQSGSYFNLGMNYFGNELERGNPQDHFDEEERSNNNMLNVFNRSLITEISLHGGSGSGYEERCDILESSGPVAISRCSQVLVDNPEYQTIKTILSEQDSSFNFNETKWLVYRDDVSTSSNFLNNSSLMPAAWFPPIVSDMNGDGLSEVLQVYTRGDTETDTYRMFIDLFYLTLHPYRDRSYMSNKNEYDDGYDLGITFNINLPEEEQHKAIPLVSVYGPFNLDDDDVKDFLIHVHNDNGFNQYMRLDVESGMVNTLENIDSTIFSILIDSTYTTLDMNGDGYSDLVKVNESGLQLLKGIRKIDSTVGYEEVVSQNEITANILSVNGRDKSNVVVYDFNLDGLDDLIIAGDVYLSNGESFSTTPAEFYGDAIECQTIDCLKVVDYDFDGSLELVEWKDTGDLIFHKAKPVRALVEGVSYSGVSLFKARYQDVNSVYENNHRLNSLRSPIYRKKIKMDRLVDFQINNGVKGWSQYLYEYNTYGVLYESINLVYRNVTELIGANSTPSNTPPELALYKSIKSNVYTIDNAFNGLYSYVSNIDEDVYRLDDEDQESPASYSSTNQYVRRDLVLGDYYVNAAAGVSDQTELEAIQLELETMSGRDDLVWDFAEMTPDDVDNLMSVLSQKYKVEQMTSSFYIDDSVVKTNISKHEVFIGGANDRGLVRNDKSSDSINETYTSYLYSDMHAVNDNGISSFVEKVTKKIKNNDEEIQYVHDITPYDNNKFKVRYLEEYVGIGDLARTTQYDYDSDFNVSSKIQFPGGKESIAEGRGEVYTYYDNGLLYTVRPSSFTNSNIFTYDVYGNKKVETLITGEVVTHALDSFGRKESTTSNIGNSVTFEYIKCPVNQCPSGSYYYTKKTEATGLLTTVYFDITGSVSATERKTALDRNSLFNFKTYDAKGRVKKEYMDSSSFAVSEINTPSVEYLYYSDGRVSKSFVTASNEGNGQYGTLETIFDYAMTLDGELEITETRSNAEVSIGGFGTLSTPTRITKRYYQPSTMMLTKMIHPSGAEYRYQYDPRKMVTDVFVKGEHQGSNTLVPNVEQHYIRKYDVAGNLVETIRPGRRAEQYGYTVFGELDNYLYASGASISLSFDDLGRVANKFYSGNSNVGARTFVWNYDENKEGKLDNIQYHLGSPSNTSAVKQTIQTYLYDSFSRPESSTVNYGGKQFDSTYAYDSYGRPETLTYNSVSSTQNQASFVSGYTNGLPTSMTANTQGTAFELWELTNTDSRGRPSEKTYYDAQYIYGQEIEEYTGQLRARSLSFNNSVIDGESLYHDVHGDLRLKQSQGSTHNDAMSLTYDIDQRLTQVSNSTDIILSRQFAYDDFGNFIYKDNYTNDYSYHKDSSDKLNSMISSTVDSGAPVYEGSNTNDGTGRMVGLHGYNIKYNEMGQVISLQRTSDGYGVTYEYGPDDELIKTSYSNGRSVTFWQGMEYVDYGNGTESYRYKNDSSVIVLGENAGNYLLYRDHLGSVRSIWKDGTLVAKQTYDAYGSPVGSYTDSMWAVTDSGYTGHIMVKDTPFIFMNARLYSYELGTFTSADPIFADMSMSGGLNAYGYAGGSPYRYWDPSGMSVENMTPLPDLDMALAQVSLSQLEDQLAYALNNQTVDWNSLDGNGGVSINGELSRISGSFNFAMDVIKSEGPSWVYDSTINAETQQITSKVSYYSGNVAVGCMVSGNMPCVGVAGAISTTSGYANSFINFSLDNQDDGAYSMGVTASGQFLGSMSKEAVNFVPGPMKTPTRVFMGGIDFFRVNAFEIAND